MNKQEAIEKLKKLKGLTIKEKNLILDIEMISKGDVLEIIEQIDEPVKPPEPKPLELEKPVVPQFVADWLEVCKENLGFGLSTAMSHSTSAMKKQPNWVKGWFNLKDNQETFAKAWLYGYEIEKENLYTVEIPNPNSKGTNKIYLCKDDTTGKVYLCKGNFNPSKNRNLRLTESEIKQDFEWAWQFAEEVK